MLNDQSLAYTACTTSAPTRAAAAPRQVYKDYGKAESLYGVVLAAEPTHLLALDHQSALLSKRGQAKQAADMHRKVCGLDPHHTKKVTAVPGPAFACQWPPGGPWQGSDRGNPGAPGADQWPASGWVRLVPPREMAVPGRDARASAPPRYARRGWRLPAARLAGRDSAACGGRRGPPRIGTPRDRLGLWVVLRAGQLRGALRWGCVWVRCEGRGLAVCAVRGRPHGRTVKGGGRERRERETERASGR